MLNKKTFVKIVSSAIIVSLAGSFNTLAASAAVQKSNKNQSEVNVVLKNGDKSIVEMSNKKTGEKAYIVTLKKEVTNKDTKVKTNNSILKSLDNLDAQAKVDRLNKLELSGKIDNNIEVGTRTEFQIVSTKEQANELTTSLASSKFWHNSYIQDYSSWAGHGYHVHLSSTDASYVVNMGWLSSDAVIAALGEAGVYTGGTAIIIGALVTGAIVTVGWKEANDDGSLDIWSPDSMRNQNGSTLIKVGSNWYYI
jgi:hypothetical protein